MVLLHWPFEELHKQADIEDASQYEEQTVPEADAGVKSRKIEVVVITDASDHCSVQTKERKQL